jgi:hypothetical protein
MKRFAGFVAMGLVAASLYPVPVHAATPIAGAAGCEIVFAAYPGGGADGPCDDDDGGSLNFPSDGKFVGTAANGTIVFCAGICTYAMTVNNYGSVCIAGEPPLIEFWEGTVYINGAAVAGYNLTRIGLEVTVTTNNPVIGSAVGEYVPVPPLPTCAAPASLQVHLVDLKWSAI